MKSGLFTWHWARMEVNPANVTVQFIGYCGTMMGYVMLFGGFGVVFIFILWHIVGHLGLSCINRWPYTFSK